MMIIIRCMMWSHACSSKQQWQFRRIRNCLNSKLSFEILCAFHASIISKSWLKTFMQTACNCSIRMSLLDFKAYWHLKMKWNVFNVNSFCLFIAIVISLIASNQCCFFTSAEQHSDWILLSQQRWSKVWMNLISDQILTSCSFLCSTLTGCRSVWFFLKNAMSSILPFFSTFNWTAWKLTACHHQRTAVIMMLNNHWLSWNSH